MSENLMKVVSEMCKRYRMDDFQTTTAQSMAWYIQLNYQGPALADSNWAWQAIRKVWQGRDLPGCTFKAKDALQHAWRGAGMHETMDRSPGPDVLAESAETWERVLANLSNLKQEVVKQKIAGKRGDKIAAKLGISPGRVSQILREVTEMFAE